MYEDKMTRLMGVALAFGMGLVGCSEKSGEGGGGKPDGDGNVDQPAPEYPPNQGQPASNAPAYPAAPYGINVGSIIRNYQFVGYANGENKASGMQIVQLADFYNPTGDGVFDEGSVYGAGKAKPKALVIDVASVWCGPCNAEAADVLPGKHAEYRPLGGEFLLQLADGPTPGTPATAKNLDSWTNKYEVDFPAAIDPSSKLSALFEADAFPANFIIDTRTMRIVKAVNGVPDSSFWKTFANVVNGVQ
jgi:hypothetical protein